MADRPNPAPLEPGDYYTERGRFVFTAQYLTRRGYCCQNGCRHCPYRGRADLRLGNGSEHDACLDDVDGHVL